MSRARMALAAAVLMALGFVTLGAGQMPDFSKVEIKTEKLTDSVYMLAGAGGNIGVSSGSDGVILIDDQFAPLTEKVLAAVKAITPQPVRFVVNTHWHFDHTGGNENFGKAGSLIVGHDNVRRRMSTEQFIQAFDMKVPFSPKEALSVITFTDEAAFYPNGDELRAVHVPPAHTDGDAIIRFMRGNVVHMGDLFFNGQYPFVDLSSGGSVEGMIAAADRALKIVDERTRIIPGHGPVGDRSALVAYRDMLVTVRDRIKPLVSAGRTLAEVKQAAPLKDLDAKWGQQGFTKGEQFTEIVFRSYNGKA